MHRPSQIVPLVSPAIGNLRLGAYVGEGEMLPKTGAAGAGACRLKLIRPRTPREALPALVGRCTGGRFQAHVIQLKTDAVFIRHLRASRRGDRRQLPCEGINVGV